MIDSARRRLLLSSALIGGLLVVQGGQAAYAGEIGDAVKSLAGGSIVREKVSLKELGLTQPITLNSSDARREIYLPVPANVKLIDPSLVVDGHYIRADGGRTTYTMALDGNVVAARSPDDAEGEADVSIGVDGAPRPSGFVRLGLAWASVTGRDDLCNEDRSIGNLLQISPNSYFEYGYDPSGVTDIASVWSALPRKVTLLVASDALEGGSYDAAWRLGVALQRAGKDVQVIALPKPGSEIDTTGLKIPPALMNVPAFAALAKGGKVALANEAEVGALLLLGAPQVRADVAVSDPALAARLKTAFDAVGAELAQADPAATAALDALATRKDSLLNAAEAKTVDVRTLAGRPVIAVSPDAAAAATGLFDGLWRKTALVRGMVLNTVGKPNAGSNSVALGSLDQSAGNLDVVARGDWTTTFDLGSSLGEGKVPSSMTINVAAAPGATETSPVASVYLNDYLLGAKRLTADGKAESISVDVPSYALLPRNTVRVQFQRQPAGGNCEVPQAFPAAVLPNSRIWLEAAPAAQNFSGIVARLADDSEVIVPQGWRNSATETLPTLISVADAAGISPSKAVLSLGENNAAIAPKKPFLAFDVPVAGAADTVKVAGQHVSIADKDGKVFYDVAGLDHVAVLQAVTGATEPGISYRTVGEGPRLDKSFQLGQGDVAVVGEAGILAAVNSNGTPAYENGAKGANNAPFTLSKLLEGSFWERHFSWVATAVLGLAFLLLLLLARRARKRRGGDQA
ncbi:cellulose biosynthesis cyclic di-GMP-binding regulatory protein BcsB [Phyllobacterium leguminum]|uniref:Cellulose synthase subunit n=1 Tax=Phyllobacterium leguminum TaxID=314237 RepID=A0A318TER0_9HYPH|nr:cellulose biosynthesis cyclic di-GMP-binding regulatory protein BcsB [Phyllobacterium leguminum]PYE90003.1 cellulose synthase subunit [Phyllobacterium leguminum]